MGFFSNLFGTTKKTPEQEAREYLQNLRKQIDLLKTLAVNLDRGTGKTETYDAVTLDLLKFSLYVATADGIVDENEVKAINVFLDTDYSYPECKMIMDVAGIAPGAYRSCPSLSLAEALGRYAAAGILAGGNQTKEFLMSIAGVYADLGSVIALADGNFSDSEKRAIEDWTSAIAAIARKFF